MILNNIKKVKRDSGFTIVELLIVIVVIGILAAITIVAYSGIQSRAKTTQALTNAAATQKVAEAYNADLGYYPALAATFASGSLSTKLPSGITVVPNAATTPLNSGNGTTTVTWSCATSCTNAAGGRITYWDYGTSAVAATIIYVGTASVSSTFVNPAS